MAETTTPKPYSADPTLYLYTSLTAGSSHIITATSRLETILKANKIPFRALDVATDEKARMLWGRRSKGKKLPGLVKFGSIVGDLEEIEEWNEYGELKQQIGATPAVNVTPIVSTANTPSKAPPAQATAVAPTSAPAAKSEHISIEEPAESQRKSSAGVVKKDDTPLAMAMRQAGAEAAQRAGQKKVVDPGSLLSNDPTSPDTPAPMTDTKLDKASTDPQASAETTAGKMPMQLAAEGAKRTSVDKIAESEDSLDGETATPKSTEESVLEARRSSSIIKVPSSLSNETTVDSSPAPPDPQSGESTDAAAEEASKVKIAGAEKTKTTPEETPKLESASAEKAETIPEETPELESTSAEKVETSSEEALNEEDSKSEEKHIVTQTEKPALADITSSDKQEEPAKEDGEHQDQSAKAGDAAGISVGD